MKRNALLPLIVLLFLSLSVLPVFSVGKHISVKSLSDSVTYNVSDEDMKIPVGTTLNFEDKFELATDEGGKALINYYNEAKLMFKPSTIAKLYLNSIFIKKGDTWMKFVKRHSSFKIKTPSAVLGIRGTEFGLSVDELGNTTVELVEGEISVKTDKEERILLAGSTLTVDAVNKHIEIMRNRGNKKTILKDDSFRKLKLKEDDGAENPVLDDRLKGESGDKVKVKKVEGLEGIF